MSEQIDDYEAMKKERRALGEYRRQIADLQFPAAAKTAIKSGIGLKQHSQSHYQFRFDGKLLNFYPGNQRLYWDESARGPFLRMPKGRDEWTLMAVIEAIVARRSRTTERKYDES